MSDVPGFEPLQEASLIEADFQNADEAYTYLAARLHLNDALEHTPGALREQLLKLQRQSYVLITRTDPHRDWFTPICDVLEAASCENENLIVMYAFTIVG